MMEAKYSMRRGCSLQMETETSVAIIPEPGATPRRLPVELASFLLHLGHPDPLARSTPPRGPVPRWPISPGCSIGCVPRGSSSRTRRDRPPPAPRSRLPSVATYSVTPPRSRAWASTCERGAWS